MAYTYDKCAVCDQMDWLHTHKCYPLWDWRVERRDIWSQVRARDAKEAAARGAEENDEGDHYLIRTGRFVIIEVRPQGTQKITRCECSAEAIPTYYARELPEPEVHPEVVRFVEGGEADV